MTNVQPTPAFDANKPRPRKARHWLRVGLSIALLLAAALYIAHILHGQTADLGAAFATLSGTRIAAGFVLATLALVCPTLYHVLAVERLARIRSARDHIAAAYSLSQLVRYVPGKVLGVLFEINYLHGKVSANALLLANMVQTFYVYLTTAAFALAAIAVAIGGTQLYWILVAIGAVATFLSHRFGWCERILLWVARRVPGVRGMITASVDPKHAPFAATTLLALEWCFFIGMWYAINLGTAHVASYVLLAACYGIASVLGAFAVIMPSGLVVREGMFVGIAQLFGFDPVSLVVYAVVIRVWLTGADILVAVILGTIDRLRGVDSNV